MEMPAPMVQDLEVTQANKLALAAQQMSLNEKRLLAMSIANLEANGSQILSRIYINEFNRVFGGTGHDNYARLKEASQALMKRLVFIDKEGSADWDIYHWVTRASYRTGSEAGGGAFIDVLFEERLKPMLVDLKANFHSYALSQIAGLQSTYSIRMYEMLLHESHGGRRRRVVFDLDELKWRLRLRYKEKSKEVDKYPQFKRFRERVLEQAQRECNSMTNLSFEFEPIRTGRRVTRVAFTVTVDGTPGVEAQTLPERVLSHGELEAADALREAGFVGDAEGVVLEHGEELVRRTVEMARRIVRDAAGTARPIHNPGGLIQKLIKTGAANREPLSSAERQEAARVTPNEVAETLATTLAHARAEHAEKVWTQHFTEDEQAELHDEMRLSLTRFEVDILDRANWEGGSYAPLRNKVLFEQHTDLFPLELRSIKAFAEHTSMLEEYEPTVRDAVLKAAEAL